MTREVELQTCDYQKTVFLHVILRSHASGGTTKNLEILRCAQDDKALLFCGARPELVEGLRMTLHSFWMDTN